MDILANTTAVFNEQAAEAKRLQLRCELDLYRNFKANQKKQEANKELISESQVIALNIYHHALINQNLRKTYNNNPNILELFPEMDTNILNMKLDKYGFPSKEDAEKLVGKGSYAEYEDRLSTQRDDILNNITYYHTQIHSGQIKNKKDQANFQRNELNKAIESEPDEKVREEIKSNQQPKINLLETFSKQGKTPVDRTPGETSPVKSSDQNKEDSQIKTLCENPQVLAWALESTREALKENQELLKKETNPEKIAELQKRGQEIAAKLKRLEEAQAKLKNPAKEGESQQKGNSKKQTDLEALNSKIEETTEELENLQERIGKETNPKKRAAMQKKEQELTETLKGLEEMKAIALDDTAKKEESPQGGKEKEEDKEEAKGKAKGSPVNEGKSGEKGSANNTGPNGLSGAQSSMNPQGTGRNTPVTPQGKPDDAAIQQMNEAQPAEEQSWWERNKEWILWTLGTLVVAIVGILGFRKGGWWNKDKKENTTVPSATETATTDTTNETTAAITTNQNSNNGSTLENSATKVNTDTVEQLNNALTNNSRSL